MPKKGRKNPDPNQKKIDNFQALGQHSPEQQFLNAHQEQVEIKDFTLESIANTLKNVCLDPDRAPESRHKILNLPPNSEAKFIFDGDVIVKYAVDKKPDRIVIKFCIDYDREVDLDKLAEDGKYVHDFKAEITAAGFDADKQFSGSVEISYLELYPEIEPLYLEVNDSITYQSDELDFRLGVVQNVTLEKGDEKKKRPGFDTYKCIVDGTLVLVNVPEGTRINLKERQSLLIESVSNTGRMPIYFARIAEQRNRQDIFEVRFRERFMGLEDVGEALIALLKTRRELELEATVGPRSKGREARVVLADINALNNILKVLGLDKELLKKVLLPIERVTSPMEGVVADPTPKLIEAPTYKEGDKFNVELAIDAQGKLIIPIGQEGSAKPRNNGDQRPIIITKQFSNRASKELDKKWVPVQGKSYAVKIVGFDATPGQEAYYAEVLIPDEEINPTFKPREILTEATVLFDAQTGTYIVPFDEELKNLENKSVVRNNADFRPLVIAGQVGEDGRTQPLPKGWQPFSKTGYTLQIRIINPDNYQAAVVIPEAELILSGLRVQDGTLTPSQEAQREMLDRTLAQDRNLNSEEKIQWIERFGLNIWWDKLRQAKSHQELKKTEAALDNEISNTIEEIKLRRLAVFDLGIIRGEDRVISDLIFKLAYLEGLRRDWQRRAVDAALMHTKRLMLDWSVLGKDPEQYGPKLVEAIRREWTGFAVESKANGEFDDEATLDLDAEGAVAVLQLAGVRQAGRAEKIPSGTKKAGMTMLDTGNADGFISTGNELKVGIRAPLSEEEAAAKFGVSLAEYRAMKSKRILEPEERDDAITAIIDHHGPTSNWESPCTTKIIFEVLTELKVLTPEKLRDQLKAHPSFKRESALIDQLYNNGKLWELFTGVVEFVTQVDNLTHEQFFKPEAYRRSYRSVIGLYKYMGFYKVLDYFLHHPNNDGSEEMSEAELREYGLLTPTAECILNKKKVSCVDFRKHGIEQDEQKIRELESSGRVVQTRYGKLVIDIGRKLKLGASSVSGLKGKGWGYLNWSPDASPKFGYFLTFPMQDLELNFTENQGMLIRGSMALFHRENVTAPMQITLEQLLEKLGVSPAERASLAQPEDEAVEVIAENRDWASDPRFGGLYQRLLRLDQLFRARGLNPASPEYAAQMHRILTQNPHYEELKAELDEMVEDIKQLA